MIDLSAVATELILTTRTKSFDQIVTPQFSPQFFVQFA